MNILHSHTQGFILSIALDLTENWKVKKKMEASSFCQCDVTHLKQQSRVCQCTVWRTQTPKNILDLPKSWIKKIDFQDTWRKPKRDHFVKTPDFFFFFFGLTVPVLTISLCFRRLSLQQPTWVSTSSRNGDAQKLHQELKFSIVCNPHFELAVST